MVASLRPRQWTKNLVLFVPLVFARVALLPSEALRALAAVAAFCLAASAVYLMNDWHDRQEDRRHPTKRHRPIARGDLGLGAAWTVALVCAAGALAIGSQLGHRFLIVMGSYIAFQVVYTSVLKRMVLIDVMAIAVGFLLRIYAGAVAVNVSVSNWLFLCALLLSVFLGFAKRRAEITTLEDQAGEHRRNLNEYSVELLDQLMSISAACALLAYGLYTVAADTVAHVGSDGLKFTVPFVLYGIFRYLFLVHRRGQGGAPEQILLGDRPIQIAIVTMAAVAGWVLYARQLPL